MYEYEKVGSYLGQKRFQKQQVLRHLKCQIIYKWIGIEKKRNIEQKRIYLADLAGRCLASFCSIFTYVQYSLIHDLAIKYTEEFSIIKWPWMFLGDHHFRNLFQKSSIFEEKIRKFFQKMVIFHKY